MDVLCSLTVIYAHILSFQQLLETSCCFVLVLSMHMDKAKLGPVYHYFPFTRMCWEAMFVITFQFIYSGVSSLNKFPFKKGPLSFFNLLDNNIIKSNTQGFFQTQLTFLHSLNDRKS